MLRLRKITCTLITINVVCIAVLSQDDACGTAPDVCVPTPYRSYNGSCNNLNNPKCGSAGSEYGRLLPPNYGDGVSSFPTAVSGNPLPNARKISATCYPKDPVEDDRFTMSISHFGQLVAHDISYTQYPGGELDCCTRHLQYLKNSQQHPPSCFPINIPSDDPVYSMSHGRCMSYKLTDTNQMHQCSKSKNFTEKINRVPAYLDLHMIYGISDETNRNLRTFECGLLQHEIRQNQEWCKSSSNPSIDCIPEAQVCYDTSGDLRINQNPELTLLHVMFLREHNRIARELCNLNPQWDDEKVFQEARKINIAQYQHITYTHLLPIYMGNKTLIDNQIIYEDSGSHDDYNETICVQALNECAQAALRYFHTLVWGRLDMYSEDRIYQGSIKTKKWWKNPGIIEMDGVFDNIARGGLTQNIFAADCNHDPEVTESLLKLPMMKLALDLKALDIHRSRDHGVPSYNDMREFCGLTRAKNFVDYSDVIDDDKVNQLADLYENCDDVDFCVGASLERPVTDALVGPTFLAILAEQFLRLRRGDRFFYDNGCFPPEKLNEIKKASIARLYCNNGKNITMMQPCGFHTISNSNTLQPCTLLPSINLSVWKEL